MTPLLAGSLALIGASALALLFGWASTEQPLLWASIGASGVSVILLALAYWRARGEMEGDGDR